MEKRIKIFAKEKILIKGLLIIFLLVLLFALTSCELVKNIRFDDLRTTDGVMMQTEKETYPTNVEDIKVTWINNTSKSLTFGDAYYLVKKAGDKWRKLPVPANTAFNDIGYIVSPGSETEHIYHLNFIYKNLTEGTFRIVTHYFDDADIPATSDDAYYVYAEFNLTDEQEPKISDFRYLIRNYVDRMMFYVGEEKDFDIDMQANGIVEFRMTEPSVLSEDGIVHREDIAAIYGDKITMHKSGRYKLWAITEDLQHVFYYIVLGVDVSELKIESRTDNEFETTLYFHGQINQGEEIPIAVVNKNISGEALLKMRGHADPYMGTPSINIYTVIDGYKLSIGQIWAYSTVMSSYFYWPDAIIRHLRCIDPIVNRTMIMRISDGGYLTEDDPFLEELGFASNIYVDNYEENKRIRDALLADLKTRYDAGDPRYNWEWNEIYNAYPLYNPLYSSIVAPKGFYHIELSTGEVIENAFEII